MSNLSDFRKKASKDQWQCHPMPLEQVKLSIKKTYSPEQWKMIKLGLVPEQMEDKWFIYEENYWLYFCRSWTGNCIYKVKFELLRDIFVVSEAYANRDPSQYTVTDDDLDLKILLGMIDRFLLGNSAITSP